MKKIKKHIKNPVNKIEKKNQIALSIGNAIKEIRQKKKMKLLELTSKSGVQIATLSRIEHGRMIGTIEVHIEIARALGVQLSDLYKDIEIKPESPTRFSGIG